MKLSWIKPFFKSNEKTWEISFMRDKDAESILKKSEAASAQRIV